MKGFAALVLLTTVGCSNSHLYGGPVNKTPYPLLPGATAEPNREPAGRRPTGGAPASTRLVCRGGGYPSGWIAVAYSDGMPECVGAGERYSAALLQRLDLLPRDAEIFVCSDQRVPGNWVKASMDSSEVSGDHCPSSEHPGSAQDRVMMIRKVR